MVRKILFWLATVLACVFLGRKPLELLVEKCSNIEFRTMATCLDDPFTPILFVLDVKQPITSSECSEDAKLGPYLLGCYAMIFIILSLFHFVALLLSEGWLFAYGTTLIDVPPLEIVPFIFRASVILSWIYFLVATVLSRLVA